MSKPIFPDIADLYADRMRMSVTVFGVNITFGLGAPHPPEPGTEDTLIDALDLVRVRMSLEHAKVFAMMLKKNIKQYERATNTVVAIPKEVIDALVLGDQDW